MITLPMTTPADPAPFDPRALRNALGSFATGVTVITTYDRDGKPAGMTANSFSSLSLSPPLVLWSIGRESSLFGTFSGAAGYTVNILRDSQRQLCDRFARDPGDRFAGLTLEGGTTFGPALKDALAVFDCELVQRVEGGDHLILIGQVHHFHQEQGTPLLFYRGELTGLRPGNSL